MKKTTYLGSAIALALVMSASAAMADENKHSEWQIRDRNNTKRGF